MVLYDTPILAPADGVVVSLYATDQGKKPVLVAKGGGGKGDTLTLVVPVEIGTCRLHKMQKTEITKWLKAGGIQ